MTTKYERLLVDLTQKGKGQMKCFGSSMLPILSNPSLCTYRRQDAYAVGDIVFCKVRGRYIDAHKITKIDAAGRCMIANNRGHENGWASAVYGRVIEAVDAAGHVKAFA